MHLLQRDDLGVRRAEASRKGAACAVGREGAGGQRSARESRREPGNAAERERPGRRRPKSRASPAAHPHSHSKKSLFSHLLESLSSPLLESSRLEQTGHDPVAPPAWAALALRDPALSGRSPLQQGKGRRDGALAAPRPRNGRGALLRGSALRGRRPPAPRISAPRRPAALDLAGRRPCARALPGTAQRRLLGRRREVELLGAALPVCRSTARSASSS